MLPIQTIVDTHEALSDWKFTAQEANQVIVSVWESVIGAIVITAMMGMSSAWIGGKLSPEEELENLNIEVKRVSAKLHDLDENAAHAREHFSRLMVTYGYGVIPSEVEMRRHVDMKIGKKRWEELEGKAERTRGYLFKLVRRRKELKGEI